MANPITTYLKGIAAFTYFASFGLLKKSGRRVVANTAEKLFGPEIKKPHTALIKPLNFQDFFFEAELKGSYSDAGDGNVSLL